MTYDTRDLTIEGRLTRIETGIEHINTRLIDMVATWDRRVKQRYEERAEVEARLDNLEQARAGLESSVKTAKWFAGFGGAGGLLALVEWLVKGFPK